MTNHPILVIYLYLEGVIYLAQFCTCGSLMINDTCTNKNCSFKPSGKSAPSKTTRKRTAKTGVKEPKVVKAKKASKCVTYNLYDTEIEENAD
jgi:hypothetical protein